jgi:glyoxylase-like metal-dependent hydrolase (beta-lactamase superfamily II)
MVRVADEEERAIIAANLYVSIGESMLEIKAFTLGAVQTNVYLIWDSDTKQAVVVDPAWDGDVIAEQVKELGLSLEAIWLTHAHFDHFAGTVGLLKALGETIPIALHREDHSLWKLDGGAPLFGIKIERGAEPSIWVEDQQQLSVGAYKFHVRHAPGHTPGHVIYVCQTEGLAFCGDVIFKGSIGRTDLPGGSFSQLIQSITDQVMSLPDEMRLFSGHGPETSVGFERLQNPFLNP